MAYPSGVFSPSARSNGQNIDASHINDLQTEVTAIETALLGTITHSLNVSGASTLATVQAGASTFTVRPVEPPPHAVKVFLAAAQEFGSSNLSTIAWTEQAFLTNSSAHSTASNAERLIPQSTGLYQFVGQIVFSQNGTGTREVVLRDSSNTALYQYTHPSTSTGVITCPVVAYKRYDAVGGYVALSVGVTGASTLSAGAGLALTQLTMVKL